MNTKSIVFNTKFIHLNGNRYLFSMTRTLIPTTVATNKMKPISIVASAEPLLLCKAFEFSCIPAKNRPKLSCEQARTPQHIRRRTRSKRTYRNRPTPK